MHDLVSVKVVMAQRRRLTEGASHGGENVVLHMQLRLLQYLRSTLNTIMCMLQAWHDSHAMTRTMCMMSSPATWWPATSWCLPALSHRCTLRSGPLRYGLMVLLQCIPEQHRQSSFVPKYPQAREHESLQCCQAGEAYSTPAMLIS